MMKRTMISKQKISSCLLSMVVVGMSLLTTSCGSDSVEGNPNYLSGDMIVVEVVPGASVYLLNHGDGTASVTYDRRNPMHLNTDNSAELSDYVGEIVIPATVVVEGVTYQVTGVTDYAFMNNTQLTKVTLPATVKSVGTMAFYKCETLQEVNIPEGVSEIPDYCFQKCSALRVIHMPSAMNRIGIEPFKGCKKLEKIAIPQGITALADSLFNECSQLSEVTLPEGLISIGKHTFRSAAFERVNLPTTLTTIAPFAFEGCSKMTYVEIPASMTELKDSVFNKCSNLKKVILPETMTTLGVGSFAGCRSLSEITIPASVTSIGKNCFTSLNGSGESNWKNLTINMPSTTPPVLTGAICNPTNRMRIVVPKGYRDVYAAAPYWSDFKEIMERNF